MYIITIAILIWLAVEHSIVAPWWIWSMVALFLTINAFVEIYKMIDNN